MTECVIGPNIGKNGYARLPGGKRGVHLYAHRVAWELEHGEIPKGMHLHHTCENSACVNVEHLELLTPKEHRAKHRLCEHGEEHRHYKPNGHSICRICSNERARIRTRERYWTDPVFREKVKKAARETRLRGVKRGSELEQRSS